MPIGRIESRSAPPLFIRLLTFASHRSALSRASFTDQVLLHHFSGGRLFCRSGIFHPSAGWQRRVIDEVVLGIRKVPTAARNGVTIHQVWMSRNFAQRSTYRAMNKPAVLIGGGLHIPAAQSRVTDLPPVKWKPSFTYFVI